LEEEKMRKFALILAIVAMVSASAFAGVQGPITKIATNFSADRPTVDIGPLGPTISWANNPGAGAVGSRWVDGINVEVNVAFASQAVGWASWAKESGIAGEWAVYGGPPSLTPLTLEVEHLPTGVCTSIAVAGTGSQDDYHFTDVNEAGDVFFAGWGSNLMHANVSAPGTVNILSNTYPVYQRMRAADQTDRIAYDPDGTGIAIYDLGTQGPDAAGSYKVATEQDMDPGATVNMQKFYMMEIADAGDLIVTNCRYDATAQESDIYLIDVQAGLGSPIVTNLTGDGVTMPTWVRNDPMISRVDADTAIIVWDENPTGQYDVVGAYVTGLATSTPVMGPKFTICGGVWDQRFADIDGNLVAWKNLATGDIEYRFIPEPASLSLLALGGLALLRRR
jgi:hypothetical protein